MNLKNSVVHIPCFVIIGPRPRWILKYLNVVFFLTYSFWIRIFFGSFKGSFDELEYRNRVSLGNCYAWFVLLQGCNPQYTMNKLCRKPMWLRSEERVTRKKRIGIIVKQLRVCEQMQKLCP